MTTIAPAHRVGLVGYGRWGALWAKVLAKHNVLGWIVDLDHDQRMAAKADHPGVPVYEEVQLWELSSTSGTIVATPPDTHRDVAEYLLDEAHPVLVEKPMAACLEDAQAMASLATRKNTRLMVDHTFLYAPVVEAAMGWVRDRVGRVSYSRYMWHNVSTKQSEGAVWNLGPHPVSISTRLAHLRDTYVRSVSTVQCQTRRFAFDSVDSCFRMGDGSVDMISLSNFGPEKIREFTVLGEKGSIVCRPNQCELIWQPASGGGVETWFNRSRDERQPLSRLLARFLDETPLADEHAENSVTIVAQLEIMDADPAQIQEGA